MLHATHGINTVEVQIPDTYKKKERRDKKSTKRERGTDPPLKERSRGIRGIRY